MTYARTYARYVAREREGGGGRRDYIYLLTMNSVRKASSSSLEMLAVAAVAVASPPRLVVTSCARSNPFISMGLSRVSEGPSTDDVIDVGRLMPYWACIRAKRSDRASERKQGNTRSSFRVSHPSRSPRTVNGHVVESIIEWPSFSASSSVFAPRERTSAYMSGLHVYTYINQHIIPGSPGHKSEKLDVAR